MPEDSKTPVMNTMAMKIVSHSLIAVVVLALIAVVEEELQDGEWPKTKAEWMHFLVTCSTASAVAIFGLIRSAMGVPKK